jgi:hypothetical protein
MKKIVLVVTLVSMLFQIQVAQAQALPFLSTVFNGTINRAIGAGILSNLARRGITVAANDAMFAETMSFVGKAANDASYVSTAAGLAATVLGAPVWLSAAISVGALAAAGGVAWGLYQLTQTGTGLSTQLTLTPTNPVTTPVPVAAPAGSWTVYMSPGCNAAITTACGADPALPVTLQYYTQGYPNSGSVIGCINGLDCATQRLAAEINFESTAVTNVQGSMVTQTPGCLGDGCVYSLTLTWTPLPSNPTVTGENVLVFPLINPAYVAPIKTTTGMLSSLPITADMLAAPLPQGLTASLADSLWRNAAAQPGYDGYPYSATSPVTQADVATAPVSPTWSDAVEGLPRPLGSTSVPLSVNPIPNTPYTPGTTGTTNPASGTTGTTPTQDPCVLEPNASACAPLGTAPAVPPIPTSSASVGLSPVSVGPSDGTCPAALHMSVFGSDLAFDYSPLCSFVVSLRPLILALCALAAALIVVMGIR